MDAPLRNPSLLYLHGDVNLHHLLLPEGIGRYWALQGASAAGSDEAAMSIPNMGLLFVADAVAPNASAAESHFPRRDLWLAERGGRAGDARSWHRLRPGAGLDAREPDAIRLGGLPGARLFHDARECGELCTARGFMLAIRVSRGLMIGCDFISNLVGDYSRSSCY